MPKNNILETEKGVRIKKQKNTTVSSSLGGGLGSAATGIVKVGLHQFSKESCFLFENMILGKYQYTKYV